MTEEEENKIKQTGSLKHDTCIHAEHGKNGMEMEDGSEGVKDSDCGGGGWMQSKLSLQTRIECSGSRERGVSHPGHGGEEEEQSLEESRFGPRAKSFQRNRKAGLFPNG